MSRAGSDPPPSGTSPFTWRRLLIACSIATLVWTIVAHAFAASNLWDKAQAKTVGYTTDILANGHWVLPVERGELPATKPPLYNWIATPFVRWLGYGSELGHKTPSVLAFGLCWLLIVRIGNRAGRRLALEHDADGDPSVGWLAGIAFATNYPIFVLAYRARPDMLLTLWLLIGWAAGTMLLIDERRGRRGGHAWLRLALWGAVALAGLTKGPAVAVLIAYVLLAARVVGGRWRTVHALGWWWGLPLVLSVNGVWLWAVWQIDPTHVTEQLWFNEFWGRVTGLGPEGSRAGPWEIVRSVHSMPAYYLLRFAPWSVPSILALIALYGVAENGERRWRTMGDAGLLLHGAALFVVVVIGLFTLSAGKRADYAAPAYAQGALLASWWCLGPGRAALDRARWVLPAGLLVVFVAVTVANERRPLWIPRDFGDAIDAFAHEAGAVVRADPHPVAFVNTGTTQMQALAGFSEPDGGEALDRLLARRETFWVFAGGYAAGPNAFEVWLPARHPDIVLRPLVRSRHLPETEGWLIQVTLFEVSFEE